MSDPFVNHDLQGASVIVALLVFPIRLVVTLVVIALMRILAACGIASRLLQRILLFCHGFHYIVIHGKAASQDDAPVMVCNHRTFFDPIFLFMLHGPSTVSRTENKDVPFIGPIIDALDPIYVQREAKSKSDVKDRIRDKLKSNRVLIFPEATCTNGSVVMSFKYGAFDTGHAVQPIVIKYPGWNPSWVNDGPSPLRIWLTTMLRWHNPVEIQYLDVVKPPMTKKVPEFARLTQKRMAKALGVPATQHSFYDVRLVLQAMRKGYRHFPTTELAKYKAVNFSIAISLLDCFDKADPTRTGKTTKTLSDKTTIGMTFDEMLQSYEDRHCH